MPAHRHLSMSVGGALRRTDAELKRHLGGAVTAYGKTLTTGKQIRDVLEWELHLVHELIPLCSENDCPNFSYKTGCPGHEMPGAETGGAQ